MDLFIVVLTFIMFVLAFLSGYCFGRAHAYKDVAKKLGINMGDKNV